MLPSNIDELLPIFSEILYIPGDVNQGGKDVKGGYGKRVLAICKEEELRGDTLEFLEKILGSCTLAEPDFKIVSVGQAHSVLSVLNLLQPELLFLFGMEISSDIFTLKKSKYKPYRFNNIKMVLSDSLEELKKDKEKRNALWNQAIKPLFNIS